MDKDQYRKETNEKIHNILENHIKYSKEVPDSLREGLLEALERKKAEN